MVKLTCGKVAFKRSGNYKIAMLRQSCLAAVRVDYSSDEPPVKSGHRGTPTETTMLLKEIRSIPTKSKLTF